MPLPKKERHCHLPGAFIILSAYKRFDVGARRRGLYIFRAGKTGIKLAASVIEVPFAVEKRHTCEKHRVPPVRYRFVRRLRRQDRFFHGMFFVGGEYPGAGAMQ